MYIYGAAMKKNYLVLVIVLSIINLVLYNLKILQKFYILKDALLVISSSAVLLGWAKLASRYCTHRDTMCIFELFEYIEQVSMHG